jgi:hypothetical protein
MQGVTAIFTAVVAHWQAVMAVFIAVVAALFVGSLLWRRDNIPGAAYWAFCIFLAFPLALFILQETDVATPWGTFSVARSNLTGLAVKVADLEVKVAQLQNLRPPQHWRLAGEGVDCVGGDVGQSPGATPDEAKCTSASLIAVCWDGQLYRNNTGPSPAWCTYKTGQCVQGSAPGRLFKCNPGT